jgi:hypothetical protein
MFLQEESVNLVDDNPHSFEQFGALRRGAATRKILRQHVKLLREVLKSVGSHELKTLPRP